MDSEKEEIIHEIVNWLINPGQQSSYAEMITFLDEKTIAANPRLSKRQLMLFVDYVAFEMLNKNIPFRKAEEISPKQAIDPQLISTISVVIEEIKIQRKQDGLNTIDEVDIIVKPDTIPTRLQNFLMENGLNLKELFQTSQTELAKVPNFGETTLSFIAKCIEEKKFQLKVQKKKKNKIKKVWIIFFRKAPNQVWNRGFPKSVQTIHPC